MKINRRPLLAIIPAAALAGSMLTAPVAGAQSSLPTDAFGSFTGSLGSNGEEAPGGEAPPQCEAETEVVHEGNLDDSDWAAAGDETPAELQELPDAAAEGAPAGPGALYFPDDVAGKPGTSMYKAVDMPLGDLLDEDGELTPIGFKYFSDGTAPALQLRISQTNYYNWEENPQQKEKPAAEGNHFDSGFATIVLSPAASGGAWEALTPEQVEASDEFWVTKSVAATTGLNGDQPLIRGEKTTLENIIKMNPDAHLDEVGVQKTRENDTANTYIDNFLFGCVTTDFEVDEPEDPTDPTDPNPGPDFGSLALGGGLAFAAALAVGGGAFAIQNGMIQLPPELAALLPA